MVGRQSQRASLSHACMGKVYSGCTFTDTHTPLLGHFVPVWYTRHHIPPILVGSHSHTIASAAPLFSLLTQLGPASRTEQSPSIHPFESCRKGKDLTLSSLGVLPFPPPTPLSRLSFIIRIHHHNKPILVIFCLSLSVRPSLARCVIDFLFSFSRRGTKTPHLRHSLRHQHLSMVDAY